MIHTHKGMKYQRRNYDKEAVKAFIMEHYPYDEVIAAFEKVGFDLDDFFLTKANDIIQDEEFYISLFLEFKECLTDYFADLANGYWDIPQTTIGVSGICRQLFFCETEDDLWNFLYDYCPAKTAFQIYKCYMGTCQIEGHYPVYLKDPVKADGMINYFINKQS